MGKETKLSDGFDSVMARVQSLDTHFNPYASMALGQYTTMVTSKPRPQATTPARTSFDSVYQSALSSTASIDSSVDGTIANDSVPVGTPYADLFNAAARRNGLSPKLLAAVASVETNFHPNETSSVGAQGLMQFMPSTSSAMGVDPWDPASAIDGAARLLAGHLARFGTIEAALAAYNAGSGTVARAGGLVPENERSYVTKVLTRAQGGV